MIASSLFRPNLAPWPSLFHERALDEAAKATGVSPTALLRWMKEPEFDAALREARRAAFRQSIAGSSSRSGDGPMLVTKLGIGFQCDR